MNNTIFKNTFSNIVQKQIQNRKNNLINFNSKSAFILLYSNAQGFQLPLGNYQGDIYNIQNRPKPYIQSVTINNLGDYGMLDRISITWKCTTLQDLQLYQKAYMTPGISVVLQFGWNYKDHSLNLFDKSNWSKANYNHFNQIKASNKGNLYISQGYITNFSWNVNNLGQFICNTQVTSKGAQFFYKDDDYMFLDKLVDAKRKKSLKALIWNMIDYIFVRGTKLTLQSQKQYITLTQIIDNINESLKGKLHIQFKGYFQNLKKKYQNEIIQDSTYPIDLFSTNQYVCFYPLDYRRTSIQLQQFKYIFQNQSTTFLKIKHLLNFINNALLNFTEFTIIKTYIDENNIIHYLILDMNDGYNNKDIYNIKLYKDLIRDISINTELPTELKSLAMYSKQINSQQSLYNKYQKIIYELWGQNDRKYKSSKIIEDIPLKDKMLRHKLFKQVYNIVQKNKKILKYPLYYDPGTVSLPFSIFNILSMIKFKQQQIPLYEMYLNLFVFNKGNTTSKFKRLLPITVNITMDGIQGIEYGQVFKIDYIQNRYFDNAVFVVINVDHSVSHDNWTTNITGRLKINF